MIVKELLPASEVSSDKTSEGTSKENGNFEAAKSDEEIADAVEKENSDITCENDSEKTE